ncbi:unnamed protein product [Owenia fusiformis]|uniref:Hexosyltransferase n=1 Tax=Owenia fusiformis TaxID=6347 RepID=A0A8J1USW8_OWEFU|nr:unnamed protein product [Owenia fusiformis]
MLRIYRIFMFVLCSASIMFTLLGLYPENQEVQVSDGELMDQLSVGYTRRGKFISGNVIKGNVIDNDGNNTKANNTNSDSITLRTAKRGSDVTKNNSISLGNNKENKDKQTKSHITSSIFLDYRQVLKNGNFSANQSVNISELRPDKCDACFPQSSYIYKNDNLCSTKNSTTQVKLLVIIFTVHHDMRTRNSLRKTWTSISNLNTKEMRYVFLLGKHTRDPKWNVRALAEAKKYGDILIKDFMDEYKHLTLKTMSGLKWAAEFCSNAKYVMKTDTDMWVNTPRLLQFIDSFKIKNEIIGTCPKKAKPIRHNKSKYYVSPKQFPHLSYPGFCSGTGYVTTMKVVKDIVKVSPNIPFFFLEDIYVGLCNKALGYKVRSVKGFHAYRVKFNVCGYKQIITSHHMPRGAIEKIWNTKCDNKTLKH